MLTPEEQKKYDLNDLRTDLEETIERCREVYNGFLEGEFLSWELEDTQAAIGRIVMAAVDNYHFVVKIEPKE